MSLEMPSRETVLGAVRKVYDDPNVSITTIDDEYLREVQGKLLGFVFRGNDYAQVEIPMHDPAVDEKFVIESFEQAAGLLRDLVAAKTFSPAGEVED